MKKHLLFLFSLLQFCSLFGQDVTYGKKEIVLDKPVVVNVSSIQDKWIPVLNTVEMPKPGSDDEKLEKIKEELAKKYPRKNNSTALYKTNKMSHGGVEEATEPPVLLRNFEGNNGGIPLDNDMAISNGGKLVSVTNSIVYMFDVEADTLLQTVTLTNFFLPLGLPHSKFDPKVLYDPLADRFILLALNGSVSTATKIIFGFSQTNDPQGNWNLYTINGNPYSLPQWSDYPMMAITEKDFFLTINILQNGMPWQTGFLQTLVWQLSKDKGYNGQPLVTTMWDNIEFNGKKIRNLCPAKAGGKIEGPNMYFLSNRNLVANNDSLFLVEITNSQESGTATLTAKLAFSPFHYFVPPSAQQPGGKTLQTNDSRVLAAMYHNNKIHFVQNTLDTSTGMAAIYHGVMSNLSSATPSVSAHLITDTVLEFGYPNVSYCGTNITHTGISEPENECIISFSHSASTVFPGTSAVYYNNEGNYSPILNIKSGFNYIYYSFVGNNSRWGDYAGSQTKYNDLGKVWVAHTFGQPNNTYGTWIAELGTPQKRFTKPVSPDVIFFPNPVSDVASVNFFLDAAEKLTFTVYDELGRLVVKLSESNADEGQNIFSFSTVPLRAGTYVLVVESETKTITKEKFVKY